MSRNNERPQRSDQLFHHSRRQSLSKPSPKSYKDYTSLLSDMDHSSHYSEVPLKGARRSNKINSLQQQFQDLKKKIKEVENKNELIIQKINSGKDVKRKNDDFYHNQTGYFNEDQGTHSEIIPTYIKKNWPPAPMSLKGRAPVSVFNYSPTQLKTSNELTVNDFYNPKKINQSSDISTLGEARQKNKLKVDIIALEDKYNKQQSKFEHVKNNFKNYSDCVKLIVENQLSQFMQNLQSLMNLIYNKNNRNKDKLNRIQNELTVIRGRGNARRQSRFSNSFDVGLKKRDKSESRISEISKTKNKQFESLISKYEQLLRTKNEEIQKLTNQIKLKERQHSQIKDKYDELKEEKRRMGHEHDEMVSKLQAKIQALNDAKFEPKKNVLNLFQKSKQEQKQVRQRSKEKQKQQSFQESMKQIKSLESKLSFTENRLQQKVRTIQQMQLQMKNMNLNKTKLINEYQQTLEKTRVSHKNKNEQMSHSIDTLKSTISNKDQIISKQLSDMKELQNKQIELQIELSSMNQKLGLKQEIDRMERSALQRAQQMELNISLDNVSIVSQKNFNLKVIENLEKEKRELQMNYDRLKGQYEIYRLTSKKQGADDMIKQKDTIIKDLKTKIQSLSSSPKRKQSNLLQPIVNSTQQSKIQTLEEENIRLKNINEELKRENINVNSKAVGLTHDVNLNQQLHRQQQERTKELKKHIQELEEMLDNLQNNSKNKNKQLEIQKLSYESQVSSLTNELKLIQNQLATVNRQLISETDKVNIKVLEVKKLQEQIQDLKAELFQANQYKQALQLKLNDFQEDTKKQGMMDSRINQEYKGDILRLKEELEKLYIDNTALAEINKHQRAKIDELELEVYTEQSQDQSLSSISDMKTVGLVAKLRTLEGLNLEHDINRANLERHLKNSEQNNTRLMQEVNQLLLELERKKSQFSSTIITYDQRIHEMEEMLQAAERALKEREESRINISGVPQVIRSHVKSQNSLMFSNASQIYGDEFDFKFSEDGDDHEEINVETIFNNINYPYENIKLKRKDQVEFIKNTAQLINRLKSTINDKNRRIKALERRIEPQNPIGKLDTMKSVDHYDIQDFNENYSVKFDDRKQDRNRKIKQLENQTHLVMQENNLLLQQVTNLQDQLQKSEEQQNNLVRLKQVLKEQVRKLQKTLDQKVVIHQEEVRKLKLALQQNEAVHNSQTMKILLPKIFSIISNQDYMRREEKRKELQEYMKIISALLRIEAPLVTYSMRR